MSNNVLLRPRVTPSMAVPEGSSALYEFDLVDQAGAAVPLSALTALTLKLYDRESGDVIHSRDHQTVKNANGGTFDTDGHGTWTLAAADNPIVDDTLLDETHIALFHATWSGGELWWELKVVVRNFEQVPA